jgi:membrane fusion protein (multidrug efflux system)
MESTAKHPIHKPLHKAANYVILAAILALVAWVLYKFGCFSSRYTTDNAQIRRQITPVNSRVQGYVRQIAFQEYTHVKQGDVLLMIDDSEYALSLAQAEANYEMTVAGKAILQTSIDTARNNLLISDAAIDEVRARLENAEADLQRHTALLSDNVVTQSQYDRTKTEASALEAKHQMLIRQRHTAELAIDEQVKRLTEIDASLKLAQAAVDMAKLNLSYTRITAPCSGFVGRKEIQPGQLIQPGQTLVSIVDDAHTWVIANLKERRTEKIGPGSRVTIEVDAISGRTYEGRVASISGATGSAYSFVPTDNSAGNFIKIEQLIPIRIEFTDKNAPENIAMLRSGMSATITVEPTP